MTRDFLVKQCFTMVSISLLSSSSSASSGFRDIVAVNCGTRDQSVRSCSFFISFNAFTTGHEQCKISTFTDIRKHSTCFSTSGCFQTEVFKSNTLRTSPTVSIQVSIFGSGFVQNIFLFCLPHAFSPQKKDCERLCVSSTKIGTAKVGIVRKVRLNGVGWPFVDENKLCVFFDHGSRKLAFTGYRGDITCQN